MNETILFIIKCLYFMLPAHAGNMAPVIVKNKFLSLNKPIDHGKKIGEERIFGSNKTYRGFIFAILFGILIALLQKLLNINELEFIDYDKYWLIFGFLMGFGAITGDLVKSFFKRRFNIQPGKKFIPFDQIDFTIGALLFSWAFVPSIKVALVLLVISPLLHILVNHIAYWTKIRKTSW